MSELVFWVFRLPKAYNLFSLFFVVCCLHGEGGPVELYKGPSEDRNLLMRQDFEDIGRFAFTFYLDGNKEGEKSSSSANPFGLMIWSFTFLASVICMF